MDVEAAHRVRREARIREVEHRYGLQADDEAAGIDAVPFFDKKNSRVLLLIAPRDAAKSTAVAAAERARGDALPRAPRGAWIEPDVVQYPALGRDLFRVCTAMACEPALRISTARIVFHSLAMELRRLHDSGCVHRDVKLENVAWDGAQARLLDFASAAPASCPHWTGQMTSPQLPGVDLATADWRGFGAALLLFAWPRSGLTLLKMNELLRKGSLVCSSTVLCMRAADMLHAGRDAEYEAVRGGSVAEAMLSIDRGDLRALAAAYERCMTDCPCDGEVVARLLAAD